MSLGFNRDAYADCYGLLDRALASPRGVQKVCTTHEEAFRLRNRVNKARVLDRDQSRKIYSATPDHPLYNTSDYYKLTVRIEEDPGRGVWLLLIEKNIVREIEVEELPSYEDEMKVDLEELLAPKEVEDEFELDPGGGVEQSPPRKNRARRF
jgi:hypothetical protein